MKRITSTVQRLAIGLLLSATFAAAGDSGYHLLKTFKLGGDGGWDLLKLDASTRRLYITRGTHVIVIDADTGAAVGDIPDTPGVHGVALAGDLGRGFTSNGRENTVTIFDLQTLKPITKVGVGENPDTVQYDPATKHVFTFNGRSNDATVIDPVKASVIATIKLGGKPEFAIPDDHGEIFVNMEDTSEIVAIDSVKMEVKARWPLAPCQSPTGLVMDGKNRRLFAGCANQLMAVVDADSGKVITTLPIGRGVDGTKFEDGLAFASCGEGMLSIIKEDSPDKFRVLDNVPTAPGARTLAVDKKNNNIYLVTAKFGPAPAPTADQPHPRPAILPDSFEVLVFGK